MEQLGDFLDSEDMVDKKKFKQFLDRNMRFKSIFDEYKNLNGTTEYKHEMMLRFLQRYINDQSRYDHIASLTEDPISYLDSEDDEFENEVLAPPEQVDDDTIIRLDENYLQTQLIEFINSAKLKTNEILALQQLIKIGNSHTSFYYRVIIATEIPPKSAERFHNYVIGEIPLTSFSYRLGPEEIISEMKNQIMNIKKLSPHLNKNIKVLKHTMSS